jgi:DNA modification methylase
MGVGSAGIAAVQEKRKFIGIELDKTYYDKAVEKISMIE